MGIRELTALFFEGLVALHPGVGLRDAVLFSLNVRLPERVTRARAIRIDEARTFPRFEALFIGDVRRIRSARSVVDRPILHREDHVTQLRFNEAETEVARRGRHFNVIQGGNIHCVGACGFELPEVFHLHAAFDARERHVLALRLRCLKVAAHGHAEGRAGEQSVRRNIAACTEVRAVDVDVCSRRSELKFTRAALEGDWTERRADVALCGQINRVCAVKRRSGALRTNVAARIQADGAALRGNRVAEVDRPIRGDVHGVRALEEPDRDILVSLHGVGHHAL